MNKKFINLLLASVLAVSSAQVFTSCKDNEADLQANVQYQYESLEKRVAANEDFIRNTLPGQLAALEQSLEGKINGVQSTLQQQMDNYKTQLLGAIETAKNDLQTQITNNDGDIKALQDSVKDLDSLEKALQGGLSDLKTEVGTFKDEYAKKVQELVDSLTSHNAELKALRDSIDDNITLISNLRTDLDAVQQRVDAVETAIACLDALKTQVGTLEQQLQAESARITTVEGTLTATQTALGNLTTDVNNYIAATDGRLQPLEDFMNTWQNVLPQIASNAAEALATANANAASIEAINNTIEDLIDADASNASLITGLQMQINDMLARMEEFATLTELGEVSNYLQNLAKNYYSQSIGYTNLMIEQVLAQVAKEMGSVNTEISNIYTKIGDVESFQNKLEERIKALESNVETLEGNIADINIDISNINGDIEAINGVIGTIQSDLESLDGKVVSNYNDLNTAINALNEKVDGIGNGLGELTGRVEEIAGRLSGIVLQGTYNNAIGSLRLPIGIQSNLLLAYLGEVENAGGTIEFPLVEETAGTYNGDISNSLPAAEAAVLGVGTGKVPVETYEGFYMNTTESNPNAGYLGTVYATLNPSKVDLSDKTFKLVNSRGEQIVNELTFEPSDKELDFGYSRSAENGFYEAAATVDINETALKSVRFTLNDNLKSTVKEILQAPRASLNRNTVSELAKVMIDQFNGFLPAIGIEATWNDSELGQMGVTSNYGIAAAVVKPLSFKFFQGMKIKNIPNLPTISKIQDKFNTVIDDLTGDLHIDLTGEEGLEFNIDDNLIGTINVNITIPPIDNPTVTVTFNIDGTEYSDTQTIDLTDLNKALQDVATTINGAFVDYNNQVGDMNQKLQDTFDEIESQVNELIASMETNVNETIDNVVNKLQDKVNGIFENSTLNGLLDRIDAVINRLNRILDDPNHYLQPVLFFSTDSEFAEVSRNKYVPTQLNLVGNANAITLVPTTYTYETVAPVFKKYVAVTKVWKNGDAAQNNIDHVALEANNNTNFSTYMNQVVDGSCRRIALKLQKGYTYEVFYQALDFNGYVSGGKYYISVK